ncbi:hypothetical protein OG339_23495 [Streptosporangium sp. NBC_01495]|nr:hypothetical protein [Streptosporangium sp. NBC_01495]
MEPHDCQGRRAGGARRAESVEAVLTANELVVLSLTDYDYSDPKDSVEAHRPALEVLTGIEYLGEDQGLAALYYQIGIDMFWTALAGYLHGQAVAEANGVSAVRRPGFSAVDRSGAGARFPSSRIPAHLARSASAPVACVAVPGTSPPPGSPDRSAYGPASVPPRP